MDTRVMLDPSLLLKPSALERTLIEIPALIDRAGFEFFVAPSMVQTMKPYLTTDAGRLPDFFKTGREFVDLHTVTSRLANVGVTVWELPTWARAEFAAFYGAIGEQVGSTVIRDILFDEWFFLTHESWLVSRLKAPFRALARAGELGVEVLNPIVRKMLKEDASYVVRTADRLRVLGKWMAVGGPVAAGLLNPIAGVIASGVSSGYLLLDPPAES